MCLNRATGHQLQPGNRAIIPTGQPGPWAGSLGLGPAPWARPLGPAPWARPLGPALGPATWARPLGRLLGPGPWAGSLGPTWPTGQTSQPGQVSPNRARLLTSTQIDIYIVYGNLFTSVSCSGIAPGDRIGAPFRRYECSLSGIDLDSARMESGTMSNLPNTEPS